MGVALPGPLKFYFTLQPYNNSHAGASPELPLWTTEDVGHSHSKIILFLVAALNSRNAYLKSFLISFLA